MDKKIPKNIVYAKKMQLPSGSANILQTLNMAWAFVENNMRVNACVSSQDDDIVKKIERDYCLEERFAPDFVFVRTRNKGIYSIVFFIFLLKNWFFGEKSIFIARDMGEGALLARLKSLSKKDHIFVYEMHDSVYLEMLSSKKIDNVFIKRKEKYILDRADLIVYTGPYLKNIVRDVYSPNTKDCVVSPGYNPKIFAPVLSDECQIGSAVVAYFGTLFPDKGVDVFLETLCELPHSFSGVVVGGNPAKRLAELQHRAMELGLGQRLRFLGQVPPSSVSSALAGVDAVVIPFQTATEFLSPIKLYESLALGLPIIATPMPALVELSKTIKSLVVAADCTPKSLAACIQALFSDKDRLCATKEFARTREEVYTWSSRANKILNYISDN